MTVKPQRILCLLMLSLLICSISMAGHENWSTDIARRDGDPSPSAYQSRIDNYKYQDEQVNLDPDDGELRVLRANQKNELNEFATALIPVKNVSVRELRPIAREICGMEGGYAQVVRDNVKKLYWVQVTCPPWQLPYVKAAIQALDKDWVTATDDGTALIRYDAKNRDVGPIDTIARIYAGGSSVEDTLENSATHVNDPSLAASWKAVMEELDRPEHEIKVDAQFIEVDTQNDLKMGLDYIAWKNGPGRNLFEFIFAGLENVERYRGASSIFNPTKASITTRL